MRQKTHKNPTSGHYNIAELNDVCDIRSYYNLGCKDCKYREVCNKHKNKFKGGQKNAKKSK